MIKRTLAKELIKMTGEYPVITVIGPRQSGKTTLVKNLFNHYNYLNLENPENRRLAFEDPKELLRMYPAPVIIDEIQRVPELLSWIQIHVDNDNKQGQYILTGSHQLLLREQITQSLAGRTALLMLLPFSIDEIASLGNGFKKEDYMTTGFLPRVYDQGLTPVKAYRNYFHTYIERDVRNIIQLKNTTLFENFMRLLASRIGSVLNLEQLGNEIGVSSTTLKEWLSVLEASFIIFKLPPYYKNFGKRLLKSPKYYFIETGLAAWLLNIENSFQALRDPLHGSLFENMVLADILKSRVHNGLDPRLYYWRDSNGNEIDIIIEKQRSLIPVEIKSAETWHSKFLKGILWGRRHLENITKGFVVYSGDKEFQTNDTEVVNFKNTAHCFG